MKIKKLKIRNIEFASKEDIEKKKMNDGVWIPCIELPEYMCSNMGHIKETKSGKILKEHKDDDGYLRVWMTVDGHKDLVLIHNIIFYSHHPEKAYEIVERQIQKEEEQEILKEMEGKGILNQVDESVIN